MKKKNSIKGNLKNNKKILGGLLSLGIVFLMVATVVAYPDGEKKEEKMVVEHTVPEEDPFFSVGCDFLVIKAEAYKPYIQILFDSTIIYIDTNNDQIYDHMLPDNKGGVELDLENELSNSLNVGSRIHTNKPVAYLQDFGWGNLYVPSIDNLKNEYYIYKIGDGEYHHITVPEKSTIYVDENFDGTVDQEITVLPLTKESFEISANWAQIYSSKPFYLYSHKGKNGAAIIGPPGEDYYLPQGGYINHLIISYASTNISVDNNNDGNYDEYIEEGKGIHGPYNYNSGAHIHSSAPITIYYALDWDSDTNEPTYLLPSNMLGSDLWGKFDRDNRNYITGFFSNTTYYVDYAKDNNLIPDNTGENDKNVGANEVKKLERYDVIYPDNICHMWGSKPFYVDWRVSTQKSVSHAYSYILSTTYHEPNELGLNETVKMNVRVFNPFATTEINNISMTIKIDDQFKLSGDITLEITIKKLHLDTDFEKDTETITVTPTNENNLYTFTLSKDNSTIFESLSFFEYYDIDYEIITPEDPANYAFEPVEVSYDASTWDLPTYS